MKTFKKYVDERMMSTPQKVTQMNNYWKDLDHMASDERKKKNMQPDLVSRILNLIKMVTSYHLSQLKKIEIIKMSTRSFNHQQRVKSTEPS